MSCCRSAAPDRRPSPRKLCFGLAENPLVSLCRERPCMRTAVCPGEGWKGGAREFELPRGIQFETSPLRGASCLCKATFPTKALAAVTLGEPPRLPQSRQAAACRSVSNRGKRSNRSFPLRDRSQSGHARYQRTIHPNDSSTLGLPGSHSNSHQLRGAGATVLGDAGIRWQWKFQSSPAPRSGCNP